jgi:hypothetical protein
LGGAHGPLQNQFRLLLKLRVTSRNRIGMDDKPAQNK